MASAATVVTFDDKEIKDILFAEARRRLPKGIESGSQSIEVRRMGVSDEDKTVVQSIEANISFRMKLKAAEPEPA